MLDAMLAMKMDPFAGDVVKLKGSLEGWRLRVGRWRVLFAVDQENKAVAIAGLGPRGDIHK
ncbi:MAG: type II toxin-antitoxin system RelE/ParE family toxin [Desulfovibrio sp.]|nr:type II toxin-antitoxin system RelE/ParE family toxin [Desulfovibrio sp.]